MFGKHFVSMYEGSMIGKGAVFFAVWGYIISHFVPDRTHGAIVELNPKLIAFVLGEPEKLVDKSIAEMCEPDPKSRTKTDKGRKLVKLSEYQYRVVNGARYRAIRDHEDRKRQNREAQERFRAKTSGGGRELEYVKAERDGATQEELDKLSSNGLPDNTTDRAS